jgi:hypothetical protein
MIGISAYTYGFIYYAVVKNRFKRKWAQKMDESSNHPRVVKYSKRRTNKPTMNLFIMWVQYRDKYQTQQAYIE